MLSWALKVVMGLLSTQMLRQIDRTILIRFFDTRLQISFESLVVMTCRVKQHSKHTLAFRKTSYSIIILSRVSIVSLNGAFSDCSCLLKDSENLEPIRQQKGLCKNSFPPKFLSSFSPNIWIIWVFFPLAPGLTLIPSAVSLKITRSKQFIFRSP